MVFRVKHKYALLQGQRFRFICAGGLNTLFGYFFSIVFYYWFCSIFHVLLIGIISTIVNITFSFLTYKLIVFRTHGRWIQEYLRCYVVYGVGSLITIVGLWFLVDLLKAPFWLAQGGLMSILVLWSYVGNSRYSFQSSS